MIMFRFNLPLRWKEAIVERYRLHEKREHANLNRISNYVECLLNRCDKKPQNADGFLTDDRRFPDPGIIETLAQGGSIQLQL
jgi:hypothetical protein